MIREKKFFEIVTKRMILAEGKRRTKKEPEVAKKYKTKDPPTLF